MARRSRRKVTAIDLSSAINEILQEYGEGVTAAIAPTTQEVAEDTVKTLKTTGDYEDRTGDYRKSFTQTTEKTYRGATSIIHNESPEYRIAHLLEHGHMNRDGTTRAKAFPHWKPAEIKAVKEFEQKLRENIQGVE